ncbi:uncharacterized protein AMSG_05240 [Thecamonas trahens ATCC 50062]|uniref:TIR domain-containing protein n=1 Tax=Thecamonas trahens ATCC 50062 TaxID=461836 RepID=A0A0L0DAI1_THETB|nr:hypothetical protein AMSG_05240 [Thecamonas trahens ATCC 50062]KNC49245.1 hypothetical protein AMSG_05240 [Thecamonas trahens ATCC 50062]|eukprot:XP_013757959.1 hypothetical protein AMSG_05240 [Thecamonas trahens ATCC 50062]
MAKRGKSASKGKETSLNHEPDVGPSNNTGDNRSDSLPPLYDVFLCHGSFTKAWCLALYDMLSERNIKTFVDNVSLIGDCVEGPKDLVAKVLRSRVVVVIVSKYLFVSNWAIAEAEAVPREKIDAKLVPVFGLDPVMTYDQLGKWNRAHVANDPIQSHPLIKYMSDHAFPDAVDNAVYKKAREIWTDVLKSEEKLQQRVAVARRLKSRGLFLCELNKTSVQEILKKLRDAVVMAVEKSRAESVVASHKSYALDLLSVPPLPSFFLPLPSLHDELANKLCTPCGPNTTSVVHLTGIRGSGRTVAAAAACHTAAVSGRFVPILWIDADWTSDDAVVASLNLVIEALGGDAVPHLKLCYQELTKLLAGITDTRILLVVDDVAHSDSRYAAALCDAISPPHKLLLVSCNTRGIRTDDFSCCTTLEPKLAVELFMASFDRSAYLGTAPDNSFFDVLIEHCGGHPGALVALATAIGNADDLNDALATAERAFVGDSSIDAIEYALSTLVESMQGSGREVYASLAAFPLHPPRIASSGLTILARMLGFTRTRLNRVLTELAHANLLSVSRTLHGSVDTITLNAFQHKAVAQLATVKGVDLEQIYLALAAGGDAAPKSVDDVKDAVVNNAANSKSPGADLINLAHGSMITALDVVFSWAWFSAAFASNRTELMHGLVQLQSLLVNKPNAAAELNRLLVASRSVPPDIIIAAPDLAAELAVYLAEPCELPFVSESPCIARLMLGARETVQSRAVPLEPLYHGLLDCIQFENGKNRYLRHVVQIDDNLLIAAVADRLWILKRDHSTWAMTPGVPLLTTSVISSLQVLGRHGPDGMPWLLAVHVDKTLAICLDPSAASADQACIALPDHNMAGKSIKSVVCVPPELPATDNCLPYIVACFPGKKVVIWGPSGNSPCAATQHSGYNSPKVQTFDRAPAVTLFPGGFVVSYGNAMSIWLPPFESAHNLKTNQPEIAGALVVPETGALVSWSTKLLVWRHNMSGSFDNSVELWDAPTKIVGVRVLSAAPLEVMAWTKTDLVVCGRDATKLAFSVGNGEKISFVEAIGTADAPVVVYASARLLYKQSPVAISWTKTVVIVWTSHRRKDGSLGFTKEAEYTPDMPAGCEISTVSMSPDGRTIKPNYKPRKKTKFAHVEWDISALGVDPIEACSRLKWRKHVKANQVLLHGKKYRESCNHVTVDGWICTALISSSRPPILATIRRANDDSP